MWQMTLKEDFKRFRRSAKKGLSDDESYSKLKSTINPCLLWMTLNLLVSPDETIFIARKFAERDDCDFHSPFPRR